MDALEKLRTAGSDIAEVEDRVGQTRQRSVKLIDYRTPLKLNMPAFRTAIRPTPALEVWEKILSEKSLTKNPDFITER